MPFKDREVRRAYQRDWYLRHRAEHMARGAEWRRKHPERVRSRRVHYKATAASFLSDIRKNARGRTT